ncbi:RNA-directed DNA polymerase (reverse transcriptase)-related family protein [Rhynchospora pubera]|uniref:RNA-directed DNA polymerase (Reverse transcriptase)-related family protein n=1 Tax=Rhynchospora pubera TaxID=906938 RepID=A0AAV8H568_9POAL|nr:RNA-directed DNA polymerase (reverse transcriptase)-related family protein [Rhynchospora pubera]
MAILYSRKRSPTPPLNWLSSGSFFWRDLFKLRLLFQISTTWEVGDGASPSFWFDAWAGSPILFLTKNWDRPPKQALSLQKALPLLNEILPRPQIFRVSTFCREPNQLQFSGGLDRIVWKWSVDGNFCSNTTYKQLAGIGKVNSPFVWIWKLKLPPKVKFFCLLLLQDKLLTQHALLKRNIHVTVGCSLCSSDLIEDSLHLFFTCPYSQALWQQVQNLTGLTLPLVKESVLQTILGSFLSHNGPSKNKMTCFQMTALWTLWGERNNRIFRGVAKPVHVLARSIQEDGAMFLNFS